jgi:hypothetical protein
MRQAVAVLHDDDPATAGAEETRADERRLDVSIVMPCLNEEDSIAACVEKAWDWLKRSGYSGEVLVVDAPLMFPETPRGG